MFRHVTGRNLLVLTICLAFIGCLSFSLDLGGRRSSPCADGVLVQNGSLSLSRGQCRDIFYPVGYHSPPNLEVEPTWSFDNDRIVIVAQERDHFRVECLGGTRSSVEFKWTARGLPVTVALPPAPVVVIPATMPAMDPPGVTPPRTAPAGPNATLPNPLPPLTP